LSTRIAIFLFEDIEVLDFAGPYEVFTTASRVAQKKGLMLPFTVFSVAAARHAVCTRAGMKVMPDVTFTDSPAIDVLIIPGGVVAAEVDKPEVIAWIKNAAENARLTASVCTGVFLLAKAGIVNNQNVTTHWEDIADLRQQFPHLKVNEGVRWVEAGEIVTSAGISAGIDMSLHLVERLAGRELALATARQMEFDWQEN
jgi:transcriptional regulator GlxA family with amidase domain